MASGSINQIKPFAPGMKEIRASDLNAIVDFLKTLQKGMMVGGQGLCLDISALGTSIRQQNYPVEFWYGIIVDEGPASESDYTDNRYWVKRAEVSNSSGNDTSAVTFSAINENHPEFLWTTVTNVAEIEYPSHYLRVGTLIRIESCHDKQYPRIERWITHTPYHPTSIQVQVKKVSGAAGDELTKCNWGYDCWLMEGNMAEDDERIMIDENPLYDRADLGAYDYAATGSYGLACKDTTGTTWQLLCVFDEVEDTGVCDCS